MIHDRRWGDETIITVVFPLRCLNVDRLDIIFYTLSLFLHQQMLRSLSIAKMLFYFIFETGRVSKEQQ